MQDFPSPVFGVDGQVDAPKWLQKTIERCGHVISNNVIKVDDFVNHQVEPKLMSAIGKELATRFKECGVTKILTIEVSGIAPSYATAVELNVPMIFGRAKPSLTTTANDYYSTEAFSFTKQINQNVIVKRDLLTPSDRVLIVDDIIAHGESTVALLNICEQAGATCVGVGAVLEKSFQPGRSKLEKAGVRVEALARIKSMDAETNQIEFLNA
eukprot:Gregarina_sp_Pseudo_9__2836@NODE_3066_length_764_cov_95_521379_g2796_i0_p1_GENE_NODE_3066_length_764_cov_95_521379_g2796_i0NODE_3066_length_764_cov_95_521379_g2796_i0_p1_ORF_typecomplete_len227_score17_95Pribosyltran/PF00156_27/8_8e16Pribosyl_synth/PF14572_6/1_2e02Pribosyl_synth/PF14572_6/0_024PRTase_2/PF15609_6/0_038_NODE_3066_length_764_cov_95_521379_g2796_i083718